MVSDWNRLYESQAWKELARRVKIVMHQKLANRPGGNSLAERSHQSIT